MDRTVAVPIVPSVKEGREGNVTACVLSQERSVEGGVEPDGGEAFHGAVRPFCMRLDRAARMVSRPSVAPNHSRCMSLV